MMAKRKRARLFVLALSVASIGFSSLGICADDGAATPKILPKTLIEALKFVYSEYEAFHFIGVATAPGASTLCELAVDPKQKVATLYYMSGFDTGYTRPIDLSTSLDSFESKRILEEHNEVTFSVKTGKDATNAIEFKIRSWQPSADRSVVRGASIAFHHVDAIRSMTIPLVCEIRRMKSTEGGNQPFLR